MGDTNRHGLKRAIREEVKRAVRQQCAFGCVVCGSLPYQYHHFDPVFADAREHRPEGIALLCPNHHGEVTAGRLSNAYVAERRAAPAGVNSPAVWNWVGASPIRLVMGQDSSSGDRAGLRINETDVVMLERGDGDELVLTANVVGPTGRQSVSIVQNEVTVLPTSWDVRLEGLRFSVRDAHRTPVLVLLFDAERGEVIVERLAMALARGNRLDVTRDALRLDGPDTPTAHVSGNKGFGGDQPLIQMVVIGEDGAVVPQGKRATYTVDNPRLGNLSDWIVE